MGNDNSSFANCELGAFCEISSPVPWTLHSGKCPDGNRLSAFVYDHENVTEQCVQLAIKHLKTLKHPGIVKYLGVKESKTETWMLTEMVRPLELVLDTLAVEEICAGLYNILQVLEFLHQAGLCHNNLNIGSVFVTNDGSWKLGGLEWLCSFSDATPSHLAAASKWRSPHAVAPEEKDKNFAPSSKHGHARDVYAFGLFAEQLMEYMTSLGDLTKTFELRVADECLNADPEQRPVLSSLLDDRLFRCDYVEIVQFLRTLTLQNEVDKDKFFKGVVKRLYGMPVSLLATRLVHPLLARFVLLEQSATEFLLPHLLTPVKGEERTKPYQEGQSNPLLPEPLFNKYIIPELFKIFHVRDAHVRITLLRNFSAYASQFDKQLLKTAILPQVLLGIRDTNDELVSLSLQALADLVHVLGGDIVIGAHRARVFSQGVPKILPKGKENGILMGPQRTTIPSKKSTVIEDREKKRQEARRRVEERRKKREEEKKKFIEKVSAVTVNLESDDGGPADINRTELSTPNKVITVEDSHTDHHQNVQSSKEMPKSEEDDDDEVTPAKDMTESDIDLEIEAELEAMESTLCAEQQQKTQLIYSNTDADNVHMDWSDISPKRNSKKSSDGGSGVLKLSSPKTKTSPPPKSRNSDGGVRNYSRSSSQDGVVDRNEEQSMRRRDSNGGGGTDSGDDWNTSWGEGEGAGGDGGNNNWDDSNIDSNNTQDSKNNKLTTTAAKNKSNKETSSVQTHKKKGSNGLGEEFDIMALDIKTSGGSMSSEVDYFADMMPEIKPKADSLMTALGLPDPAGQGQKNSNKKKDNQRSFAVEDNSADMESGWDDVDWGES